MVAYRLGGVQEFLLLPLEVGHVAVVVLQVLLVLQNLVEEVVPSVAGLDSCSSFQALVAFQVAYHVDWVEGQAFDVEIQGVSFQVALGLQA